MTKLKALSIFSGCGGLDCGIQQAGFDIVLGLDNDHHSSVSHDFNFPESKFIEGDISELSEAKAISLLGDEEIKDIDLLIGGPPCPPFSKSRFYRTDKPRAMKDPVGEATIGGYLETLRWLRPKAFLLENVAGMAFKPHQDTLRHIFDTAAEYGYKCKSATLNAADYGVPQIRQRFFIVGTRDGIDFDFPLPTHTSPDKPDLIGLPAWRTAGEAIMDLDLPEFSDIDGHYAGGKHHHLLEQIPPGDNYLFFTEKRGHPEPQFEWRKRYWSFLLKLSPDMPSWTIQARRSNNMGPFHWRNRILRIEELLRLQTFPDNWYLDGKVDEQWRQIGNAVPPLLAREIGKSIASAVKNLYVNGRVI
jgi:DNA (cytosine-5)-methyltransferase 1